jgi:hypothetical protein
VAALTRVLVVASLLGALVAAVGAHAATEQRARVLDRTVLCNVDPTGGIRELNVYGQAGVRLPADRAKWMSLPTAWFNSGSIWTHGLANVTAGRNDPATQVGSGIVYDGKRCKLSPKRVVFTRKGLDGGGPASQLQERWECVAAKQVLVRVRGEFAAPARWRHIRQFQQYSASGPSVRSAQLMATTLAGKPLAYADVNESGRARLFFRASCLRGRI